MSLQKQIRKRMIQTMADSIVPITDLGFDPVTPEITDKLIESMAKAMDITPSPQQVEVAVKYARQVLCDFLMLQLVLEDRMLMTITDDERILFGVNNDLMSEGENVDV